MAQIYGQEISDKYIYDTIRNAVGTIVRNINSVADAKKRNRNRFEDKL